METDNKLRLAYWLKVFVLGLWGLFTIITCAGVWNYNQEGFVKWTAFLLMICNGVVIYFFIRRLNKEFKANLKAYYESLRNKS